MISIIVPAYNVKDYFALCNGKFILDKHIRTLKLF